MESLMEHEDIQRYIYSFGYPEHRLYMKAICQQINTPSQCIYELQIELQMECEDVSHIQYLHTKYTSCKLAELFRITKRCNCCTRHSYYKPNLCPVEINAKTNPNPHYSIDSNTCVCDCRSLSRDLYYAYWYKIGPPLHERYSYH